MSGMIQKHINTDYDNVRKVAENIEDVNLIANLLRIGGLLTIVRHTSIEWVELNPILPVGSLGVETDTRKVKLGDGISVWNDLPYIGNTTLRVTMSPEILNLVSGGGTGIVTATTVPASTIDITWTTEDSVVATVVDGVVTPIIPGTTRIVATTSDGVVGYCQVVVTGAK